MRRPITHAGTLIRGLVVAAITLGFTCVAPHLAAAQEVPGTPPSAIEAQGFVAEPDLFTRLALLVDRNLSKGDVSNGHYIDLGTMMPDAGGVGVGTGYRRWYGGDTALVHGSVAVSQRGYKAAQARFELPSLAHSRLGLGAQFRWQDFAPIDYFGAGPATSTAARSEYRLQSKSVVGVATLRPMRWMDVTAQIGWLKPSVMVSSGASRRNIAPTGVAFAGDPVFAGPDAPTFVPAEVSITIDGRDFPSHPTRGVLLRGAAAQYDDRDTGAFTFKRYESEAAGFLPIGGGRVVLAVHGWAVATETDPGQTVPFYLQPSLGGANTIRGYSDYRFTDRNMVVVNAEARIAMMTHLDFALFADAGNVAADRRDLNFDKQSYGAGLRLHTRRITFARFDAARGDEGWRFVFRLTDPLDLSRLSRRAAVAPFVP
ncbi:MAG: BamA/TamA family outer membrane protein [Acidobacteriota bacterium]|nr:BamA/TamA family outer membrane protein [Acidobacteriota bacterium]